MVTENATIELKTKMFNSYLHSLKSPQRLYSRQYKLWWCATLKPICKQVSCCVHQWHWHRKYYVNPRFRNVQCEKSPGFAPGL